MASFELCQYKAVIASIPQDYQFTKTRVIQEKRWVIVR